MSTVPSADPIRVLIVDDHPLLRDGVAALLEVQSDIEAVGEASNGLEAVEAFRRLRPDVMLIDLQMPGMNGLDAVRLIRAEAPDARVIVLTTYSGDVQAVRAMKAGASGFLLKSGLRRELIAALRAVHAGRRYVPPDIGAEIAMHSGDEDLTEREISILLRVAAGDANKEIGSALGLAEDTVKSLLKSIFGKLNVSDRTHAVTVAARRGYIVF